MICLDKNSQPFEVRGFCLQDLSLLEGMYENFSPKGRFQGLPPIDKKECNVWITKLTKEGKNFLALRKGNVIGHVVVLPDLDKGNAECLIFVDQFNRGFGIGTALIRAAINQAEDIQIKRLWLIIDAHNIRAMRLYKKCGFNFFEQHNWESERMMSYRCKGAHDG
jgi:RimJ/RimL family protein N-acetyltransferase